MASNAVTTVTQMMESLPEAVQDRVVEHLREYVAEFAGRTSLGYRFQ